MIDPKDLISIYGVVALARGAGHRLTDSSFRSYVSRGDAPAPATHYRRQPFWHREAVLGWLERRQDGRRAEAPHPPRLQLNITHELDIAPSIGDAELAEAALDQLPRIIKDSAELVGLNRQRKDTVARRLEQTPTTPWRLDTVLTKVRENRRIREDEAALAKFSDRLAEAETFHRAACDDYEATIQWLSAVQAWATSRAATVSAEREARQASEWMATLDDDVPTSDLTTTRAYADEDPSRVSYIVGSPKRWADMNAEERANVPESRIILTGADFAYTWRVPGHIGDWRLSWHRTHLYLERRNPTSRGLVLPLAEVPSAVGLLEYEIAWLRPFEQISNLSGATGLLLREIQLQDRVGWPLLDRSANLKR